MKTIEEITTIAEAVEFYTANKQRRDSIKAAALVIRQIANVHHSVAINVARRLYEAGVLK